VKSQENNGAPFLILFGVEWVVSRRIIDILVSWGRQVGRGIVMKVWRLAPLCLIWCLWQERNAQNFEDVETSLTELRKIVINTLHTWISTYHSLLVTSFADFLNFCSFSSN
jgi:hypothetical protein